MKAFKMIGIDEFHKRIHQNQEAIREELTNNIIQNMGVLQLHYPFAAGAMVFISIHELLPIAKRYHRINLFILGMVLSAFVYLLLHWVVPE